jgi:dTDP-4-dehydrorhamnose reductase
VKILVIGASGLLGTKLTQYALQLGHTATSAYTQHRPSYGEPICLDATNGANVQEAIQSIKPDIVFNTASITDVDLCEEQPELAMRVNGQAVGSIARACNKTESFLIHVSTDYVFDGERGRYLEDDETGPINAYGRSKLLGETELAHNASHYLIARTSVLYGWGRLHRANFATWLVTKLRAGEPVSVVTDQIASPTLNTNLAKMLLEAAERRLTGIIHMAGATPMSRYEFALKLSKICDFNGDLLTPVTRSATGWKARRPRDSSLDVTKAARLLDNKPSAIDEALKEFASEAKLK